MTSAAFRVHSRDEAAPLSRLRGACALVLGSLHHGSCLFRRLLVGGHLPADE